MGVELASGRPFRMSSPRSEERATSLEERIAAPIVALIRDAIARAEAMGEERARSARTHLSIAEAAEAMGISERHCRRMIDEGVVPSLRLGERVVVPRFALERLGVES